MTLGMLLKTLGSGTRLQVFSRGILLNFAGKNEIYESKAVRRTAMVNAVALGEGCLIIVLDN